MAFLEATLCVGCVCACSSLSFSTPLCIYTFFFFLKEGGKKSFVIALLCCLCSSSSSLCCWWKTTVFGPCVTSLSLTIPARPPSLGWQGSGRRCLDCPAKKTAGISRPLRSYVYTQTHVTQERESLTSKSISNRYRIARREIEKRAAEKKRERKNSQTVVIVRL